MFYEHQQRPLLSLDKRVPVVGALDRRTPMETPPTGGWAAFWFVPATSPTQVTYDREGEGAAFLRTGEREMGSTFLRNAQQVLESSVAVATVSSFSLGESSPFPKKLHTKGYLLPFAWYVCVECRWPSLQPTTSCA
jgi:hypothetical protein